MNFIHAFFSNKYAIDDESCASKYFGSFYNNFDFFYFNSLFFNLIIR